MGAESNRSRFALILPAAGSGQRLGESIPKPFLSIAGRTILEHTLQPFVDTGALVHVVIPTEKNYIKTARERVITIFPHLSVEVIEGGSERQYSIEKGLDAMKAAGIDAKWVAVHDAVRPFITVDEIQRCLDAAVKFGAAIVAVPAKDTIKMVDLDKMVDQGDSAGNQDTYRIKHTPNRATCWQAQTPQIFDSTILKKAYEQARETSAVGTDDASLVEALGHDVYIVEGRRENFKITYPIDLTLTRWLMEGENA